MNVLLTSGSVCQMQERPREPEPVQTGAATELHPADGRAHLLAGAALPGRARFQLLPVHKGGGPLARTDASGKFGERRESSICMDFDV